MREHQIVITLKPEQFLEVQRLSRAAGAKSMGIFVRQQLLTALGIEGGGKAIHRQGDNGEVKRLSAELSRLHSELRSFVAESLSLPLIAESRSDAHVEPAVKPLSLADALAASAADAGDPGTGSYGADEGGPDAQPETSGGDPTTGAPLEQFPGLLDKQYGLGTPPSPYYAGRAFDQTQDPLEQYARRAFAISPRLGPFDFPGEKADAGSAAADDWSEEPAEEFSGPADLAQGGSSPNLWDNYLGVSSGDPLAGGSGSQGDDWSGGTGGAIESAPPPTQYVWGQPPEPPPPPDFAFNPAAAGQSPAGGWDPNYDARVGDLSPGIVEDERSEPAGGTWEEPPGGPWGGFPTPLSNSGFGYSTERVPYRDDFDVSELQPADATTELQAPDPATETPPATDRSANKPADKRMPKPPSDDPLDDLLDDDGGVSAEPARPAPPAALSEAVDDVDDADGELGEELEKELEDQVFDVPLTLKARGDKKRAKDESKAGEEKAGEEKAVPTPPPPPPPPPPTPRPFSDPNTPPFSGGPPPRRR